jgi:hypothetical protein
MLSGACRGKDVVVFSVKLGGQVEDISDRCCSVDVGFFIRLCSYLKTQINQQDLLLPGPKHELDAVLVVPVDFRNYKYTVTQETRTITYDFGSSASDALPDLMRNYFISTQLVSASLSQTTNLENYIPASSNKPAVVVYPMFTNVSSSLTFGSFNISVELMVQLYQGRTKSQIIQGKGTGTAHSYSESALSQAGSAAIQQALHGISAQLATMSF